MLARGNNITTVAHYKDAAERHLQVCEILLAQLKYPQNFRNPNKWNNIIAELYYLSGYIIECAINYKYLTHKGFSDSEDYNQPTRWGHTDVRIKFHFRFTTNAASCEAILKNLPSTITLPDYLQNLGNLTTISLSSEEDKKKKMQEKWDPSVRYSYESTGLRFTATSADDVKTYYKAAKDLYRILGI